MWSMRDSFVQYCQADGTHRRKTDKGILKSIWAPDTWQRVIVVCNKVYKRETKAFRTPKEIISDFEGKFVVGMKVMCCNAKGCSTFKKCNNEAKPKCIAL